MNQRKSDKSVRIGVVQMRCSDDVAENTDKAVRMTEQAIERGADVVCLPELFRSRYFCQTEDAKFFDLAEPIPGPTTARFAAIAKSSGVTVIVSLFERRAAGLYHNTVAVVDGAQGYVGMYRKMHIPDDPRYYEKFYFTPGDLGFRAWDTRYGRIGV
ncbi:MAG TPA: nitrilase-related carbon-nitrogen hydrolase, partial [Woeseiaceae bacterium]|nr:nitrilase-related carbon-nitrogen hydrolase [Woeseiaceae bacterium]